MFRSYKIDITEYNPPYPQFAFNHNPGMTELACWGKSELKL